MINSNPLQLLQDVIDQGSQPARREFWLFLEMQPNRTNGIRINEENLPNDDHCMALAGLNIILIYNGHLTKYGALRRLCGSILAARPHLFWILDRDLKKIANLKIGAHTC